VSSTLLLSSCTSAKNISRMYQFYQLFKAIYALKCVITSSILRLNPHESACFVTYALFGNHLRLNWSRRTRYTRFLVITRSFSSSKKSCGTFRKRHTQHMKWRVILRVYFRVIYTQFTFQANHFALIDQRSFFIFSNRGMRNTFDVLIFPTEATVKKQSFHFSILPYFLVFSILFYVCFGELFMNRKCRTHLFVPCSAGPKTPRRKKQKQKWFVSFSHTAWSFKNCAVT